MLPHADALHLLFNLYWLWAFGTAIEAAFGHVRTLLLILMLAAGSSLAEYAVAGGGIGLSGVAYGLFGLLWTLHRRDSGFHDAVDVQTSWIRNRSNIGRRSISSRRSNRRTV